LKLIGIKNLFFRSFRNATNKQRKNQYEFKGNEPIDIYRIYLPEKFEGLLNKVLDHFISINTLAKSPAIERYFDEHYPKLEPTKKMELLETYSKVVKGATFSRGEGRYSGADGQIIREKVSVCAIIVRLSTSENPDFKAIAYKVILDFVLRSLSEMIGTEEEIWCTKETNVLLNRLVKIT